MHRLNDLRLAPETLPFRIRIGHALIALLASGFLSFATPARLPPRQGQTSASVQGTVRDSSGATLADATVVLQSKSGQAPIRTKSSGDGKFAIPGCPPDVYTLSASKQGLPESATISFSLSSGEKKQVDVVLRSDPAPDAMEFSDTPSFKVAGITDWSNAGLHGSDTRERTSESLTKETVALQPEAAKTRSELAKEAEAEKRLRADLAQNPNSFEANRQLGRLCLRSKRYADAIPLLQAAYRIKPSDTATSLDLAVAYKANRNPAAAHKQLQELLTQTDNADAHRLLGDLDEEQGDAVAAVTQYEKAVQLAPTEENYFSWGAELLLHRANQPAVEVYTRGSAAHPDSLRMRLGLAAGLYASGSYEAAAKTICKAADLNPGNAQSYLFLGTIEKATASPLECSAERLARFVQQQPKNALANYYYAIAVWKRSRTSQNADDLERAQSLLENSVAIDPKFGDAFLQLGIVFSEQGRSQQAIKNFQRATAVTPELPEAHRRLALAYKRAGEESKAQQEFQAYEQAEKNQTATIEKQRHELRQFIIVLKDQSAPLQN